MGSLPCSQLATFSRAFLGPRTPLEIIETSLHRSELSLEAGTLGEQLRVTRIRLEHLFKAPNVFLELCLLQTITRRSEAVVLFTCSTREKTK